MFHFFEADLRLLLLNAELADAVVFVDGRDACGISWEMPLVVFPAVRIVDHTHGVGLQDAVVFEGAATRNHVGFVAVRKDHAYTQWDQCEITRLEFDGLCRSQVDSVSLVDLGKLIDLAIEVFDFDHFFSTHMSSSSKFTLPANLFLWSQIRLTVAGLPFENTNMYSVFCI